MLSTQFQRVITGSTRAYARTGVPSLARCCATGTSAYAGADVGLQPFGATKSERALFTSESPEFKPLADHGYRFYTDGHQLEGRSPAIKRALSTRTASKRELRTFKRAQLVEKYKLHTFDTGSSRVQGMCAGLPAFGWPELLAIHPVHSTYVNCCTPVSLFNERIDALREHLKQNKHDTDSKRELDKVISRRRRMMQYLMKSDYPNYRIMLQELSIRPLPLSFSKYQSRRGNAEPHKTIRARHKRIKNRTNRGHKGH